MTNSATANNGDSQPKRRRASAAAVASHAPENLITYRISSLAQVLSKLVDASVRQNLGLTSRQWRVLVVLNRLGAKASSGDVARMANYDHSQVSRVAYELADKGLINQVSDSVDRRKQLLELTPAAINCLRDGVPASMEREARLRSRLSAADYETFVRSLELIGSEAHAILTEMKVE
jgi:DNA-binding MarR family transcriptional regulator